MPAGAVVSERLCPWQLQVLLLMNGDGNETLWGEQMSQVPAGQVTASLL